METSKHLIPLHLQVRSKRRELNMSQKELAVKSGLSVSIIEKFEQGSHTSITLETLRRMSLALDFYDWDLNLLGIQF